MEIKDRILLFMKLNNLELSDILSIFNDNKKIKSYLNGYGEPDYAFIYDFMNKFNINKHWLYYGIPPITNDDSDKNELICFVKYRRDCHIVYNLNDLKVLVDKLIEINK